MQKIEIEIPDGKRAEWVNGVLTLVDDTPKDVRDRIKTFEDACAELGDEHPLVKEYWGVVYLDLDITQDLISYLKLRIITAALNEGWEPQFINGEKRWYAWYEILSKEKCNNLTDKEKHCVINSGRSDIGTYGYLVYSYTDYYSTLSDSHNGSQLAFKSAELAEYAAKQFIDIYAKYCFKSL